MAVMIFCGPKLSICGMILGVWGVIFLALVGIFLRSHAVTFTEDIGIELSEAVNGTTLEDGRGVLVDNYDMVVPKRFNEVSTNCFIASGVYAVVFLVSIFQWKLNLRENYSTQR